MKNQFNKLDNYQLFTLIQRNQVDRSFLEEIQLEFGSRDISQEEIDRIKDKFDLINSEFKKDLEKSDWNPILTAIAINYHFKKLGKLNALGMKEEARIYSFQILIGVAIYWSFLFVIFYLIK